MTTLWINSFVLLIVTILFVAAVIGVIAFAHFIKDIFENYDEIL